MAENTFITLKRRKIWLLSFDVLLAFLIKTSYFAVGKNDGITAIKNEAIS